MAVLKRWQKIDRLIPGMPWADGSDGDVTISSDIYVRSTLIGTINSTSGTVGSTSFANGNLVLIHQSQGTGAGQWEINKVTSGGGTTSLTFQEPLTYNYVSDTQIVKIPKYKVATLNSHTITSWNGTLGAIGIVLASQSVTINGTITNKNGFRGGNAENNPSCQAEGTVGGDGTTRSNAANGNGGGGSNDATAPFGGGGGGGNATTGGTQEGTNGGLAAGSSDLTTMVFGGGGGGGFTVNNGNGKPGGGIFIIISRSVTFNSSLDTNGNNGQNATADGGGGGGGAGGSVLVVCADASLGTSLITSNGGTGGSGSGGSRAGSNGSAGRIAVHHSGTVTGTTSPTFTDVSDPTLIEVLGGSFIFNLL